MGWYHSKSAYRLFEAAYYLQQEFKQISFGYSVPNRMPMLTIKQDNYTMQISHPLDCYEIVVRWHRGSTTFLSCDYPNLVLDMIKNEVSNGIREVNLWP